MISLTPLADIAEAVTEAAAVVDVGVV